MNALITGGTNGIGYGTAKHLAEQGWTVTIVGRNETRGQQIANEIKGRFIQADLSLMAETIRVANEIQQSLDALVLCAGALLINPNQGLTAEGLERTFALNYLSRFALSQALLPRINPNGRMVMISGNGKHKNVLLNLDENYVGLKAAFRAALAVDLYAADLAHHVDNIRVHTCYPGMVRTNLVQEAALPIRLIVRLFGASIMDGSAHVARLVTEKHEGIHWDKSKPLQLALPSLDAKDINELWEYSQQTAAQLAGVFA